MSTDENDSVDLGEEVDPETLQRDLTHIKEAMGLQEQYPTAFRLWLLYGALAVFASLGSQAVVTFELDPWGHAVSWGGFYTLGLLYEWYRIGDYEVPNNEMKPSIRIQIGGIVAFLVSVFVAVDPFLADRSPVEGQAMIFGLIIAAIGATYVVQAASLRAYNVRTRDRHAFYVGGIWMLIYGAVMPNVEVLQEWGYVIFGILFAGHGIASYVFLSE